MAERQLTLPGEIVKKSNALARARWSAQSVLEPRLVALLASKINAEDEDFKVYEIHISELLDNAHSGRDYIEVEQAVEKTMSRVITIHDPKGWTKYNVFSRCRFRRKEGILELGFHPDLIPHYLQLKKNFAQYSLFEYLRLPSIYSQRIFEFLTSWSDQPEITINLSELYEMMDVPESHRSNFAAFRRRVLEKAHKDISERTELRFEWEPIKRGQAVAAIRFIFSRALIAKEAKEKTEAEQEKQSQKNNALFRAAHECLSKLGGTCTKSRPRTPKCQVCIRLLQKAPE